MARSKNTKKQTQRLNRLKKNAKRLAAYSAAAAATVITTGDRSANAGEVVWPTDPDVTVTGNPGLLFNLITGATAAAPGSTGNSAEGSFRIASYDNYGYIAGPASSTVAGFVGPGSFGTADFYPDRLSAGATVGPLQNFGAETEPLVYGPYGYLNGANGNFDNTRGYVGLQFNIAGSLHYGWAEVTQLGAGNGNTLHAFGYNDTAGAASFAGGAAAIPEPSSVLLLAAGAAGLGMFRRRRKAA